MRKRDHFKVLKDEYVLHTGLEAHNEALDSLVVCTKEQIRRLELSFCESLATRLSL